MVLVVLFFAIPIAVLTIAGFFTYEIGSWIYRNWPAPVDARREALLREAQEQAAQMAEWERKAINVLRAEFKPMGERRAREELERLDVVPEEFDELEDYLKAVYLTAARRRRGSRR
jgi:hypothetical protein